MKSDSRSSQRTGIDGPQGAIPDLPPGASVTDGEPDPIASLVGEKLRDVEDRLIEATLAYCDGNRSRAAGVLGIGVRTLFDRLRRIESKSRSA